MCGTHPTRQRASCASRPLAKLASHASRSSSLTPARKTHTWMQKQLRFSTFDCVRRNRRHEFPKAGTDREVGASAAASGAAPLSAGSRVAYGLADGKKLHVRAWRQGARASSHPTLTKNHTPGNSQPGQIHRENNTQPCRARSKPRHIDVSYNAAQRSERGRTSMCSAAPNRRRWYSCFPELSAWRLPNLATKFAAWSGTCCIS